MRVKPREIILTFKKLDGNVNTTAAKLGIHRATVYRWLKKARTIRGGYSSRGLARQSTRPRKIKRSLKAPERVAIERLRQATGWDAQKITVFLNLSVSSRTVHRYLVRRGLVREYGYYKRPHFQTTKHMHAKNAKTIGFLQMDVKYITPQLSGLSWTCYEYGIIDIFSRYKEAVILNHLDQDGSIRALLTIIPRLPFQPVFLQTDNGLEFQSRFVNKLKTLGLKHHFIHKSTPNENALIERSFRTDEEEFFFRLTRQPKHYDDLRKLFSNYLRRYNYTRPHHGIDLKTPYEIVANVMSH